VHGGVWGLAAATLYYGCYSTYYGHLGEEAIRGAVSDEDGACVLLRLLMCDEVALERSEALDRVRPHLPT